ncbi:glutathione peroxidase [Sarracenia purpurea var. burkii]
MEDESSRSESVHVPFQGMESVVATVSGYHGSERFNLIKLISQSGANYVGAMNRSTTHLVCWKFEGRKYDIAKQFNTVIVNHQWVEECLKQGRRVPEEPYLLQSGQEVGPLRLEGLLVTKENCFPEFGTSNSNTHRLIKKTIKKNLKDVCSSSSRWNEEWQEPPLSRCVGMKASRGKISTCPLCKASFVIITKVDDAASSDQKIYSQTIPCDPSRVDIFILPDGETPTFRHQPSTMPVCTVCCCREPEDLLVRCHLCQVRCIHSYCLDPPLLPWTCIHCKDFQMHYHHIR